MAAGVVQLPVDGAGKKLAAQSWTQGADGTVYGQKLIVCDAAGNEVSVVSNRLDVNVGASLPAGTNNIGDVDVLTMPAAATSSFVRSSASTTSAVAFAANASRRAAFFYNDSDFDVYIKLGATASATSFTCRLSGRGYYELPPHPIWTGTIDVIWDALSGTVSGSLQGTELSA